LDGEIFLGAEDDELPAVKTARRVRLQAPRQEVIAPKVFEGRPSNLRQTFLFEDPRDRRQLLLPVGASS
jgi:hypothetical protein